MNENRALVKFKEWEKKERKNCFNQRKTASEIRLREDCIKPIDVLSMHLDEPHLVFGSLDVEDMEELCEDIVTHLELDRATPTRIHY